MVDRQSPRHLWRTLAVAAGLATAFVAAGLVGYGCGGDNTEPCTGGAKRCTDKTVETCVDNVWRPAASACSSVCKDGACINTKCQCTCTCTDRPTQMPAKPGYTVN